MDEATIQVSQLKKYINFFMLQAIPYSIIYFLLAYLLKDNSLFEFGIWSLPCLATGYASYRFINISALNKSLVFFILSMLWGAITGIFFVGWGQLGLIILFDIIYCIGIYFLDSKRNLLFFTIFMAIMHIGSTIYLVFQNQQVLLNTTQIVLTILTSNSATLLLWMLIFSGRNQMLNLAAAKVSEATKSETVQKVNLQLQHEIRNLLTGVVGVGNFLEEVSHLEPDHQIEVIRDLLAELIDLGKQSVYATKLIEEHLDSLLNVARYNLQEGLFKLTIVDFRAVLEGAIHNNQYQFATKGIGITLDMDEHSDYRIWADNSAIITIIGNLINNAIKYTDRYGTMIEIKLYKESDKLVFSIQDEGIGIPKQKIPNIMSQFQRAYTEDSIKGFGIGLSTVYDYLMIHKALIECDSEEGLGTKFTLRFNIIPFPIDNHDYDTIIFDDDFDVHKKFILASGRKFQFIHSMNKEHFLNQIKLHSIKNIIVDISINKRNEGIDVLDYVINNNNDYNIIIHTVHNPKEVQRFINAGITYIKKDLLSTTKILAELEKGITNVN